MNLAERLQRIASSLPVGGGVLLTREQLLEMLDADAGDGVLADYTLEQVADALGRAVGTVRTWCNSGKLPGAYKLQGREWRVPAASLEPLRECGSESPSNGHQTTWDLGSWRNLRCDR